MDGEASSRDAEAEESPRWSAQTTRILHQKVLLRCDAKASTPNRREEQILREHGRIWIHGCHEAYQGQEAGKRAKEETRRRRRREAGTGSAGPGTTAKTPKFDGAQ